jgi:hypothetical protein
MRKDFFTVGNEGNEDDRILVLAEMRHNPSSLASLPSVKILWGDAL